MFQLATHIADQLWDVLTIASFGIRGKPQLLWSPQHRGITSLFKFSLWGKSFFHYFFFLLSRFLGFFLLGVDWISYPCHHYLRRPKSQHHSASERVNLPSYRSLSYTSFSSSSSSPSFIFSRRNSISVQMGVAIHWEPTKHRFFSSSPFLRSRFRLDLLPVYNHNGHGNVSGLFLNLFFRSTLPNQSWPHYFPNQPGWGLLSSAYSEISFRYFTPSVI